jgi:formylglycine-generating enzyme required for sulfatase activity
MFLLDGYKPQTQQINLQNGERVHLNIELQRNQSVFFGRPWENALGMKFMPVGDSLMVAAWETRVRDYALFVKETNRPLGPVPDFPQTDDHPVVYISRDDANAFCEWLTLRERKEERIQFSHEYRLPTDLEWSTMAGLGNDEGNTPAQREGLDQKIWPWGKTWPPPPGSGNFADEAAAKAGNINVSRIIVGYNDGFDKTSPVGTFTANLHGLHDISGNVHEWVSDNYSSTSEQGVLRGGGWNNYTDYHLSITYRKTQKDPKKRDNLHGFRVVLAKVAKETSQLTPQSHGRNPH